MGYQLTAVRSEIDSISPVESMLLVLREPQHGEVVGLFGLSGFEWSRRRNGNPESFGIRIPKNMIALSPIFAIH